MPGKIDKTVLKKKVLELKEAFDLINSRTADFDYGGGACSHFTNGACLFFAAEEEYKNAEKDGCVTKFINEGPLRLLAQNYLTIHKDADGKSVVKCKKPDWADFTKYPIQALEYNKYPDQRFYSLFFKLFRSNQNNNILEKPYHRAIIRIINKVFYNPDKLEEKSEEKKEKIKAYKKVFGGIIKTKENQIEINFDPKKLFEEVEQLEDYSENNLGSRSKSKLVEEIYRLISLFLNGNISIREILIYYEFGFLDWIRIDGDSVKLNTDFFDKASEWDKYYFSNILGQAFREYLVELGKRYRSGEDKSDFAKKASKLTSWPHWFCDIRKPYEGQRIKDINYECQLIAEKTGKSSVILAENSSTDSYDIFITDGKTKKTENYNIEFEEDRILVRKKVFGVSLLIDKKKVQELIYKIKEIAKYNPICQSLIDQMGCGHTTPVTIKRENFINIITGALDFAAEHAKNKFVTSLTNVCRVLSFIIFSSFR